MKKKTTLYHILFWAGIYLLWVLAFRRYSVPITKTMTVEFCYLIFITVDYYAIASFIVPQLLFKKRYLLFVSSIIMVIAFSAWLRALVASEMNRHYFGGPPSDFVTLYLHSIANISIWVLLVTIANMLADKIQTGQQVELLEKERVKNELDYLKAQINPHALFNSLNTIYGHIDKSNQVARNILLQFSELLRYQLYDCSAERVSLEKEIMYVKNYVAFQRLRKDEKLAVNVAIGTIPPRLEIAPLLLVVLIENAFKFVSNFSDRENSILINIFIENNILRCSFSNTKEMLPVTSAAGSNGIGIANLKRRLALLYPEKYTLTANIENDLYETELILDLT